MTRIASTLALAGFLTVIAPASTFAQSPSQPRTDAPVVTLDDILKELRLLRAELIEATGASLRAQVLVARLALQEQRVTGVGRELTEIQEKLRASEQAKPLANMLKAMGAPEAAPGQPAPGQPEAANPFLDMMRGQAEQLEKSDAELKARQEELLRLLADEQSRWTAFNAQLEALERRAIPATGK